MKKLFALTISHLVFAAIGFAAGIYFLPILTAPAAPSVSQMMTAESQAIYTGAFKKDLKGSDFLHWGEGTVSIGKEYISLKGSLAPGPDYKLYLSPDFVETEAEFATLKPKMLPVGDVKTFENFVVKLPENIDPAQYTSVIVWCESFGEFITAATYQ
ncbi:MAG: Phenylalanyl-tRNA synthetase beta subunit [uncultured Thiotrichaceae bacterium]|uniref:Phenylalanyl-tRNA synthetase beta subunit n=1 Tax=uncultured Thiotrichaceae bacterium TaxID=298394 RepID=A0A6S6T4R6_9GAMM|nr:MAG: Phenylalanyl-tRNA synthetase beta subunit [uncultured Thiotrichaceae bacterium]